MPPRIRPLDQSSPKDAARKSPRLSWATAPRELQEEAQALAAARNEPASQLVQRALRREVDRATDADEDATARAVLAELQPLLLTLQTGKPVRPADALEALRRAAALLPEEPPE